MGQIQNRILSLKQLKEVINDIYAQKRKFDKKCSEYKQPKETMEQYVYTYLNQKYGLKSLTIEWLLAIVNGISNFKSVDHEIKLFGKILKNECDEEFRSIQLHVKETLLILLKSILKEKHPYKAELTLNPMVDNSQYGTIEEWVWTKISQKMYDQED